MVRATFSTRWQPRGERLSCCAALSVNESFPAFNRQWRFTPEASSYALATPWCSIWMRWAAATRFLTAELDSPG